MKKIKIILLILSYIISFLYFYIPERGRLGVPIILLFTTMAWLPSVFMIYFLYRGFCTGRFKKQKDIHQIIDDYTIDPATDEFDLMLKKAKENKEKNKPIPKKRYIKKS